jgi:hypothetical protein
MAWTDGRKLVRDLCTAAARTFRILEGNSTSLIGVSSGSSGVGSSIFASLISVAISPHRRDCRSGEQALDARDPPCLFQEILDAIGQAQRILASYIEPGPPDERAKLEAVLQVLIASGYGLRVVK